MHYRQRLREMTDRRDALQISLDNQRRLVGQKSQRIQQITRERDEARRALRRAEAATERERTVIRRIARLAGENELLQRDRSEEGGMAPRVDIARPDRARGGR